MRETDTFFSHLSHVVERVKHYLLVKNTFYHQPLLLGNFCLQKNFQLQQRGGDHGPDVEGKITNLKRRHSLNVYKIGCRNMIKPIYPGYCGGNLEIQEAGNTKVI